MKTLTMAKVSITERAQAFSCTRNLQESVTIQGRYRNDVIRSVILHIRVNLSMMLARG